MLLLAIPDMCHAPAGSGLGLGHAPIPVVRTHLSSTPNYCYIAGLEGGVEARSGRCNIISKSVRYIQYLYRTMSRQSKSRLVCVRLYERKASRASRISLPVLKALIFSKVYSTYITHVSLFILSQPLIIELHQHQIHKWKDTYRLSSRWCRSGMVYAINLK